MAQSNNIFGLEGSIGNVTFRKDGIVTAKIPGFTADQINNVPSLIRIKENNREFGGASKIATKLRHALSFNYPAMDRFSSGRLNKHFLQILPTDNTNPKGKRSYLLTENPNPLINFQFFESNPVDANLPSHHSIETNPDRTTATLNLPPFHPKKECNAPKGATHMTIGIAIVALSNYEYNPETNGYHPINPLSNGIYAHTQTPYLEITSKTTPHQIIQATFPSDTVLTPNDSLIITLDIKFHQQINNEYYFFKQGQGMKIAAIA